MGADSQYGPRQAAYDLQKFRGKKLVRQMKGGPRYEALPAGLTNISALLLLRDQVLAPLLASTAKVNDNSVVPTEWTLLDRLYIELRATMRQVFCHLGLAASIHNILLMADANRLNGHGGRCSSTVQCLEHFLLDRLLCHLFSRN